VEKSPRLNWDPQILTIAYNGSSMWPALPGFFGKDNWVDLKLEGDVSAAPFGDGCKKGI